MAQGSKTGKGDPPLRINKDLRQGDLYAGGVKESSRWSKRSVDHRYATEIVQHPGKGASKAAALLRSADHHLPYSGGLRFAPTSGYFLATLRVEITAGKQLSFLSQIHKRPGDCPNRAADNRPLLNGPPSQPAP